MPVEVKILAPRAAATMNTQLVHEREKFAQEAEFASRLIQSWGILGVDDGETSEGYQKQKPIEPDDLVERAVLTTQLAFQAYRDKGWIIPMVSIDELLKLDDRKTGF